MSREEELWEYIHSLQAQVDHLAELDVARLKRIEKLEEDRHVLRERLEVARRGRSHGLFRRRVEPRPEPDPADDTGPGGLQVPGVGTITETALPDRRPRRPIVVATILDQISNTVLTPEFQSHPLSARDWEESLEEAPPDLLLVESAYAGVDGSWSTRIARFGPPSPHLRGVVEWCRSRSIPTVFWNKEDPVNFEWFIGSAALFDHVFTVDSDQLPRYRRDLGHDRVGVLAFFAQPAIHFPGPDHVRTGQVAFAGSYFAAKHPERRQQMEFVIDPARRFALDIFDRHGDTEDGRFRWPDRYRAHIRGGLSYLQTVEAYRRYRVFLNVNTVTESPTMCARRVFELAACGTPIVSGPSRALAPLEAQGILAVTRNAQETQQALERLLDDDGERERMSAAGREWIQSGNTASDRVDRLLATVMGG